MIVFKSKDSPDAVRIPSLLDKEISPTLHGSIPPLYFSAFAQ